MVDVKRHFRLLAGITLTGGYVGATVSDHSPLGHAATLSTFMMLLGLTSWLINGGQPAPGQPDWYPWVVNLLVPPTVGLAGILDTRHTRSRTYFSKRARESDATSLWG